MDCDSIEADVQMKKPRTLSKYASFLGTMNETKGFDFENVCPTSTPSSSHTIANKQSTKRSDTLHAAFDKHSMLE